MRLLCSPNAPVLLVDKAVERKIYFVRESNIANIDITGIQGILLNSMNICPRDCRAWLPFPAWPSLTVPIRYNFSNRLVMESYVGPFLTLNFLWKLRLVSIRPFIRQKYPLKRINLQRIDTLQGPQASRLLREVGMPIFQNASPCNSEALSC